MVFGLPTWLLVIPVLGSLIFVHELGHFVTAKWFGIKVTEFGFGFPPRIFGIRRGETIYSINWLPLGGFVKMVGEEDPTEPRSFARQSVIKRVVVLTAGSVVNLLVPIIIFAVLFMLPQDTLVESVVITNVDPGSPAETAGLRSGDTILRVDGHRVDNRGDVQLRVLTKLGETIELTVRRGAIVTGLGSSQEFAVVEIVPVRARLNPPSREIVAEVTDSETQVSLEEARRLIPELNLGEELRQGSVGIWMGAGTQKITERSYPIWSAVPMSLGRVRDVVVIFKNVLERWLAGGPDPGFRGPVGVSQITGEVAKIGISPMFEVVALLSISLGIVNILPIPALDGGRLMFVLLEWVRRGKRISPEREGLVHLTGFAILISFMVFMSYRDIVHLLNGDSILR